MTHDHPAGSTTRPPRAGREQPAGHRALRRSRRHKVVAGVCGGLGRYYDLDPVIFRVVLGVGSVVGGLGLIAYAAAWLLVPVEGEDENELRRLLSGRVEGSSLVALLCALVGCGLVIASLGEGNEAQVFSLLLAGALVGAVHWSQRRRDGTPAEADAPPEAHAPPVPGTPSWWREPADGTDTGYLWGPDDAATEHPPGPPPAGTASTGRAEDAPRSRGGLLGRLVVLAAFVALAVGVAATAESEPLGDSLVVGGACALAVLGVGLVVNAFTGRAVGGTIVTVVLMALLVSGGALLPDSIVAGWSRARWTPTSASGLRPEYTLGNGHAVLDLTALRPPADRTLRSHVTMGAGRLEVTLPDDVEARLHLTIGLGNYRLPDTAERADDADGHRTGGAALDRWATVPPQGGDARATVVLRLELGAGEIFVSQQPPRTLPEQPSPPERNVAPVAYRAPRHPGRRAGRGGPPDDTPDDTANDTANDTADDAAKDTADAPDGLPDAMVGAVGEVSTR